MCGRYSLIAGADQLALRFDFDARALTSPPQLQRRAVPVRPHRPRHRGLLHREAALMRWGLIPSWAKDKSIGYRG